MQTLQITCQCKCGIEAFHFRVKRNESIGLLTCTAGHHSLLLDSREYWADVLADGRPKLSRCRCGSTAFRITLEYEFRDNSDVRHIAVRPECATCKRALSPMVIDIKYGLTGELVSQPLDPIEQPWLQPKRRQVTSFWKPVDAERFVAYIVQSLGARVFWESAPHKFSEVNLADITFYPELKHNLLFTNIPGAVPPSTREPQHNAPLLRLDSPFHMAYSWPTDFAACDSIRLLHYIKYSEEVVRGAILESQPAKFLAFAQEARQWLNENYVSLRGKNTADNLEEYLLVKPELKRLKKSRRS